MINANAGLGMLFIRRNKLYLFLALQMLPISCDGGSSYSFPGLSHDNKFVCCSVSQLSFCGVKKKLV